jgi:hypothetical protein
MTRRRAICILAAAILFPTLEKAGVECHQRGFDAAAGWLVLATAIVKLTLLILLLVLLIRVSRQTVKRRAVCVLAVAMLFPTLQKAGIECDQHGLALAGSCLVSVANMLKPGFLILLTILAIDLAHRPRNRFVLVLVAIASLPPLLVASLATVLSGWIILDLSRPVRPEAFLRDAAAVNRLTALANEMAQRQRITWVGNSRYRFVFAIRYGNAEYQFTSMLIPRGHDFHMPVEAEDMSKVRHYDLPFQSHALQPTDRVLLDPNDYAFCRQASETIRRIGFDNIELYPEHSVVQYQIYEFIGWDNGWRYVYYFSPTGTLPEDFTYTQQLNTNWYFARKPRFSD